VGVEECDFRKLPKELITFFIIVQKKVFGYASKTERVSTERK
jgi:hypothetical protein